MCVKKWSEVEPLPTKVEYDKESNTTTLHINKVLITETPQRPSKPSSEYSAKRSEYNG
jgi:hypothetical protein